MKVFEYVYKDLKRKDFALASYLSKFYKENEQLDEKALAEKLTKDPLYLLFIENTKLNHIKKIAYWVKFIGVVILISIVFTVIYVAVSLG